MGEERKGAIGQGGKTEKSLGTERPAGGKATKDGIVPKVGGQARENLRISNYTRKFEKGHSVH